MHPEETFTKGAIVIKNSNAGGNHVVIATSALLSEMKYISMVAHSRIRPPCMHLTYVHLLSGGILIVPLHFLSLFASHFANMLAVTIGRSWRALLPANTDRILLAYTDRILLAYTDRDGYSCPELPFTSPLLTIPL